MTSTDSNCMDPHHTFCLHFQKNFKSRLIEIKIFHVLLDLNSNFYQMYFISIYRDLDNVKINMCCSINLEILIEEARIWPLIFLIFMPNSVYFPKVALPNSKFVVLSKSRHHKLVLIKQFYCEILMLRTVFKVLLSSFHILHELMEHNS